MFFADTQNKLLYAITGMTAADLIVSRADARQPNMGVQTYKGRVVRKQDIYIAKNYLNADEIDSLNRFVVVFLETAELRAKNRQDIRMDFWRENVDRIIAFNDKQLLSHKGAISHARMEMQVDAIYEQFDAERKSIAARLADEEDMAELNALETRIQTKKRSQ